MHASLLFHPLSTLKYFFVAYNDWISSLHDLIHPLEVLLPHTKYSSECQQLFFFGKQDWHWNIRTATALTACKTKMLNQCETVKLDLGSILFETSTTQD